MENLTGTKMQMKNITRTRNDFFRIFPCFHFGRTM